MTSGKMLGRSSLLFVIYCSCCIISVSIVCSMDVVNVFEKVVNLCHRKYNISLLDCVKERSLLGLDNVYRSKTDISLIPNLISLVRNDNYHVEERTGKNLLTDIESQSPQNRSLMVDNMIVSRVYDFLASRSVSIKIPFTAFDIFSLLPDSSRQEGRGGGGKKDKGGGLMAMGAMMAGTMMAVKMAAIAAMAGKALMASMMALMLAALTSLGSGHHHAQHQQAAT